MAVLVLLEKLTPTERAAYVLREAFDYPYERIAAIVAVSTASARQLVSRARKHVTAGRRQPVAAPERRRLLDAFLVAARAGDLAGLERLLAADAVSYSDGGGVVRASRVPVFGGPTIAKYVRAFANRFWPGISAEVAVINGEDAAVLRRDGALTAVLTVAASEEGIDQVLWLMNPDKLGAATAGTR
jgi:RNA polymerase sigma-70 factor (ECF subfamily)